MDIPKQARAGFYDERAAAFRHTLPEGRPFQRAVALDRERSRRGVIFKAWLMLPDRRLRSAGY